MRASYLESLHVHYTKLGHSQHSHVKLRFLCLFWKRCVLLEHQIYWDGTPRSRNKFWQICRQIYSLSSQDMDLNSMKHLRINSLARRIRMTLFPFLKYVKVSVVFNWFLSCHTSKVTLLWFDGNLMYFNMLWSRSRNYAHVIAVIVCVLRKLRCSHEKYSYRDKLSPSLQIAEDWLYCICT